MGRVGSKHAARATGRRHRPNRHRLSRHIPEIETMGISIHWLRHTTLTWVERTRGEAVARAYAGHSQWFGNNVTGIDTTAGLPEIATALSAPTGEPHPLLNPHVVEHETSSIWSRDAPAVHAAGPTGHTAAIVVPCQLDPALEPKAFDS